MSPDPSPATAPLRVGPWRVTPGARRVDGPSGATRLSPRAMAVFEALAGAGGAVVVRDALLDTVWGEAEVGDESLTQAVAELRRAFGEDGRRVIETVPRRGYRLAAPVERPEACASAPRDPALPLEAYALMLEAEDLFRVEGYEAAFEIVERLREACVAAPDAANPHARLSMMATAFAHYMAVGPDWLTLAATEAETAIRLDGDFAAGHAALGFLLAARGDRPGAYRALSAAIARDPLDIETHLVATVAAHDAQDRRMASALAEKAWTLEPANHEHAYRAARAHAARGDAAGVARAAQSCLVLTENAIRLGAPRAPTHAQRRAALAMLGRGEAALADLEAAGGIEAGRFFADVVATTVAGEVEAAAMILESIVDRGWRHGAWLRSDPAFAPLIATRRGAAIAAALGSGPRS
jgi:DNA-binding winged helix-turn-helix (wHTH) protein